MGYSDVRKIIKKKEGVQEENVEKTLKTRGSRKLYVPIYLMVFIILVTVISIMVSGNIVNSLSLKVALFFSLFLLFGSEIHRFANSYQINSRALVHTYGYFVKRSKSVDLFAISDVFLKQNPWQRVLSYGDVEVHEFSRENRTLIKDINQPYFFLNFLEKKMLAARGA